MDKDIVRSLCNYDVTADWWMRTVERLKEGVTFTEGWYDATIIMVSPKMEEEKDEFDPWGWLSPFDGGVWIMVIATLILSAGLYALFDVLDPTAEKGTEEGHNSPYKIGFEESLWMLSTAAVGQFEFAPRTGPARLFTFSVAFWALLMTSAYTANLASFLVIRNGTEVRIDTVEQAVQFNKRLCVWSGTATDNSFSAAFPRYAESGRLIRKETEREAYFGLRTGDCDIVLTNMASWEILQTDETVNGDCSLTWVGRPFQTIPASFGVKGDAGTRCTSLLR